MNSKTLVAALTAGILSCTAGLSLAAEQAPAPAMGPMGHHMNFNPEEHLQRTLKDLQGKLALSAGQQGAWQTYSQAQLSRVKQMEERFKALRDEGKEPAKLTTPERMDQAAAHMKEGAERMAQEAKDTKAFYSALTAQQKVIFDLFWQSHHPHCFGPGHEHGFGHHFGPMSGPRD